MAKYYTGIGSRQTPADILEKMTSIAAKLGSLGWTLRSGAAAGADTAFERGAPDHLKEIYLPWAGFSQRYDDEPGVIYAQQLETWEMAGRTAARFHPAWAKLSLAARNLHTRNVFQVLGRGLQPQKSRFVICWTPGVIATGGTATAVRLAQHCGVEVFNLVAPDDRDRLDRWLST
jgi:hypothetical protein